MRQITKLSHRKKVFLVVAAFLAVALVGLVLFLRSLGDATSGVIHDVATSVAPVPQVKQLSQSGKYISFSYPSSFTPSKTEPVSGNELETFAFIKRPSPFWFLNITVSSLPSGNLADDGSYNSRIVRPKQYDHSHMVLNGRTVDIFSDKTLAYSKAAFIAHDGKAVSVALSADASDDQLDQVLSAVVASVSWN